MVPPHPHWLDRSALADSAAAQLRTIDGLVEMLGGAITAGHRMMAQGCAKLLESTGMVTYAPAFDFVKDLPQFIAMQVDYSQMSIGSSDSVSDKHWRQFSRPDLD